MLNVVMVSVVAPGAYFIYSLVYIWCNGTCSHALSLREICSHYLLARIFVG
jgi:hypothetical protein